ncbi:MAG TPA: lipid A deacylase LpxR family protein [Sphingobacteriaceae bacterium]|nr:lipid A deacylase LpxR family protein [Sphingobacteriaceae bacterium]
MKIPYTIFFLLTFFFLNKLHAQSSFKNEFGFQSDNDAYLATTQDRYYTNGLSITFRHATDQSQLNKKLNKKIWEAEFGHKMYNAQSGQITNIDDVDRPFAAYMYVGGGLNWLYNSENSLKLSVHAGTIGPAALGKEVQELLHRIVGFYEIKGWEYQVNNEFGINSTVSYNHFIHRNKANNTDFTLMSYLNAGNTFTGAGAGLLFRTGFINQLFNSVSTNSIIANNSSTAPLNKKEFFFFIKPSLHLVAYDATVRGGLFIKDKGAVTYGTKPLVFSQELGLNFAKNRWTMNFGVTFKSKEIKSSAKAHQYGAATIYYRMN